MLLTKRQIHISLYVKGKRKLNKTGGKEMPAEKIEGVLREFQKAGVVLSYNKVGKIYHITAAIGWKNHIRLWAQARGVAAIVN